MTRNKAQRWRWRTGETLHWLLVWVRFIYCVNRTCLRSTFVVQGWYHMFYLALIYTHTHTHKQWAMRFKSALVQLEELAHTRWAFAHFLRDQFPVPLEDSFHKSHHTELSAQMVQSKEKKKQLKSKNDLRMRQRFLCGALSERETLSWRVLHNYEWTNWRTLWVLKMYRVFF